MLECDTEIAKVNEINLNFNAPKVCSECGNVSILFQNDLCKVCLSRSFKKLVKIIDSVRK
ncbi:hypothetical protein [Leptospira ilyithenensis]|uniref:Uncharacterized protein n=1 Tax=Leptospira ilyithenensis TaxID=2484901 RepID=A0A4R9LIT4_9LEPT|nr:hypothetical protein EHS11_19360 [Leptospira ilyithenensis]